MLRRALLGLSLTVLTWLCLITYDYNQSAHIYSGPGGEAARWGVASAIWVLCAAISLPHLGLVLAQIRSGEGLRNPRLTKVVAHILAFPAAFLLSFSGPALMSVSASTVGYTEMFLSADIGIAYSMLFALGGTLGALGTGFVVGTFAPRVKAVSETPAL